ncbi:hypothetical protein ACWTU6_01990 [Mesorhizobium sp. BHbsci]
MNRLAHRMLRLVRRFVPDRPQPSRIAWPDGIELADLVPVKSALGGDVTNKTGRVVLRGTHAGVAIKLYEAFSAEHATFLAAVAALPALAELFPEVRALHGRFVVARWIDGEPPPDDVDPANIAALQIRFHAIAADRLPAPGFDFWRDFLRPRFVRAADSIGASIEDVLARVDGASGPRVLVHPDLRPANLIRDASGHLKSIDNECLATSTVPLLDVCQTARACGDRGTDYWRAYLARTPQRPSQADLDVLRALWLARVAGAAFVAGQLGRAATVLRDYRSGANLLPFDP